MNPTIESTGEYGIFRLMQGNRRVDINHVKQLKREMERNPDLLAVSPILVNEHMFVIDGQHRYHAAKELGLRIYYVVADGANIEETRHLNTTQRRWSMLDFAQSYADSGRKDYVEFLELHKKYPQLSPSILRLYLIGREISDIEGQFRRGEFEIFDKDRAVEMLDKLAEVIRLTHLKPNKAMAVSLLDLMQNNEEFDVDLFIHKLTKESARDLYQLLPSRRGCMRSIENIYNHQSKIQKRLY